MFNKYLSNVEGFGYSVRMLRNWIVPILLGIVLSGAFMGCSKKEAAPAAPPPPPAPKPNLEYTDRALQSDYETAWHEELRNFAPPEIGEHVWVKRADGSYAGGEVKAWDHDGVVLKDGTNEVALSRTDVASAALAELFADAFARAQAIRHVEAARRSNQPVLSKGTMVGSVRYSISDNIPLRSGPGNRYVRVVVPEFSRGDMLEVLEDRGAWIRVKPRNKAAEFWIDKIATRPMPNAPPEDYSHLIAALLEKGFLSSYSPQQSEARIPRGIWAGLHPGIREGLCRMLANHSMQFRKATTEWIEIKDAEGGRRIARYSQAQGFRQQ